MSTETVAGRFVRPNVFRSVIMFLSIVGPGIITANADNDVGGILTYSQAGAQFGYSMLWLLLPITVALVVVQETSGIPPRSSPASRPRRRSSAATCTFPMPRLSRSRWWLPRQSSSS
jgi:hypothetical protein